MLLEIRDRASAGLKQIADNVQRVGASMDKSFVEMAKQAKGLGIALSAVGGSITAVAGLAVKSSLEQQVGINRLDQAMKNVGESYAQHKASIEAVIDAQERKTNFSDEQQRDALQKLISIGGEWTGSLDALKIATDLAAGAGIDLNTAALAVGKAIA